MKDTKYENLCNDWGQSCIGHGQLHKSHLTPPLSRQSFTREVAASHLVSPSRLQVARQSYILEVSHIHLCDWRRSLHYGQASINNSDFNQTHNTTVDDVWHSRIIIIS